MIINKLGFILPFLIIVSCEVENDDIVGGTVFDVDYGEPYEDTSTSITTYSNTSDSTIIIGKKRYVVTKYNIFPKDVNLRPFFCWPIVTCTNSESVLVVCTNSQIHDDNGEMDILLARKEKESDKWEIKKIFQTDSIKGRAMCPALVVDRNNGRIYLFANYFKNIDVDAEKQKNDDVLHVYKYSDDDGLTWSKEYSLKDAWASFYNPSYNNFSLFGIYPSNRHNESSLWHNDESYRSNGFVSRDNIICLSSYTNGISLKNGILLIPSCVILNGIWHSTLLIRENKRWRFSKPTPNPSDGECTVYLDNDNNIVLDCRTDLTTRKKYYYVFEKNEYIEANPSKIASSVRVSTEIINDNGFFYMCYPDTPNDIRENITFWGSRDGVNWEKIFLVKPGNTSPYGYTSTSLYNNNLYISYESPEGIFVLDLSSCKSAIRECLYNQ